MLCVATCLLALHFHLLVYDRNVAARRWWFPWRVSEQVRDVFEAGPGGREDEERAWRATEDARVAALEARLANMTLELAASSAERVSLSGELNRVEDELEQLRGEAYSAAPDLEFRNSVQTSLASLEEENAERDARVAAIAKDLEGKINATRDVEGRDAAWARLAVDGEAQARQSAVDASAQIVRAYTDQRVEAVSMRLVDYTQSTAVKFESERDLIYHWIAGTFTLLCFLVSLSGVYAHTRALAVPDVQRKILALLWMPPIYSVCCWLSLLYPGSSAGLGMIRDGYEAYTIWVFVSFLISILGDDGKNARRGRLSTSRAATPSSPTASSRLSPPRLSLSVSETKKQDETPDQSYERVVARLEADGDHLPRAFCPPCGRASARSFLKQCMIATLQFVAVKPTIAVADYVLAAAAAQRALASSASADDYDVDSNDWITQARAGLFIVANVSVTVAFSGLLKVYHAVAHHLVNHNPWPKFISVKGIVFITFWQGTVIWLMTHESGSFANKDVADAVQNFLICVEMFIASVVHSYTFAADEWQPNYRPANLQISDNLAVGDFIQDLRYVFTGHSNSSSPSPSHSAKQPAKFPRDLPDVEAGVVESPVPPPSMFREDSKIEDDDDDDRGEASPLLGEESSTPKSRDRDVDARPAPFVELPRVQQEPLVDSEAPRQPEPPVDVEAPKHEASSLGDEALVSVTQHKSLPAEPLIDVETFDLEARGEITPQAESPSAVGTSRGDGTSEATTAVLGHDDLDAEPTTVDPLGRPSEESFASELSMVAPTPRDDSDTTV